MALRTHHPGTPPQRRALRWRAPSRAPPPRARSRGAPATDRRRHGAHADNDRCLPSVAACPLGRSVRSGPAADERAPDPREVRAEEAQVIVLVGWTGRGSAAFAEKKTMLQNAPLSISFSLVWLVSLNAATALSALTPYHHQTATASILASDPRRACNNPRPQVASSCLRWTRASIAASSKAC